MLLFFRGPPIRYEFVQLYEQVQAPATQRWAPGAPLGSLPTTKQQCSAGALPQVAEEAEGGGAMRGSFVEDRPTLGAAAAAANEGRGTAASSAQRRPSMGDSMIRDTMAWESHGPKSAEGDRGPVVVGVETTNVLHRQGHRLHLRTVERGERIVLVRKKEGKKEKNKKLPIHQSYHFLRT